jgi:serine/threonine-protein kinase
VGLPAAPGELPLVPGYEILAELGRGGMGVVYKARQVKLDRVVALKMVLSGEHAGRAELARFRIEAEAVARLQHPNIVQVFEVGEAGGRPFFSLEFCPGGSLAERLRGTPLPALEAARLVETLARAMDAAHRAGVVHRDLKPANVLLSADGTPKVTDFGLAKRLHDSAGQTATGAVLGTASYMAPEQAEARKDVGPAADVYALGAILYECLTGRPPFQAATTLDTILQVVSDDPVPPRQLNPAVPRDLGAVCSKCLQKDPRRRYEGARALADDLACFAEGDPVAAGQSGLLDRVTGALDRVQLRAEFAAYGSLLLWLAPLMLLTEVWVTVVVAQGWPGHLLGLGQFGRAAGFVLAVGWHRGWRWWPRGAAERQLWAVWGGYLLACFGLGLSGRVAFGFEDTALELKFYQGLAALTALAFFALAGNFWGYCVVVGVGFLGLALVMAADLRWAPLEFGLAWAAVLVLLGTRLRRMSQ